MNIAIVVAACLGLISGSVSAQNYPQRAVRMIVAYPAGGSIDTVARLTAQRLTAALGQQFLVDNRSGAAGIIGTDNVAKAQPDGHTLLLVAVFFAISFLPIGIQSLFASEQGQVLPGRGNR
jgi:tripartite-type tricarboxylate transporter receptor subunit TctC